MNTLLPIFLDLKGRNVLLVGGGGVAVEKLIKLLESGANVTIVTKDINQEATRLATSNGLTINRRSFVPDDLKGVSLVVSAVNDLKAHAYIAKEARKAGVLVNSVDAPGLCDFYFGAQVHRGPLQIAISTQGLFPGVSKAIRTWIEDLFPHDLVPSLSELGTLRLQNRRLFPTPKERIERLKEQLTLWQSQWTHS